MTILELPWPPSVNHYWRFGNGHFHISPGGRAYKLAVAGIIAAARLRPLEGPVKVTIDAFPPDRRRRDLDNLEKCLLDSCAVRKGFDTGLYTDDSQIKRKESTMHDYDPDRAGRVILSVSPWPGAELSAVPVPSYSPAPRLSAAKALPIPDPAPVLVRSAGDKPWLPVVRKWLSHLATRIFRTKATPRWASSGAWPNNYGRRFASSSAT